MIRTATLATAALSACLAFGAIAHAAGDSELSVAVVDLQRALNESKAGKAAKEEFKAEVDGIQSDLEKKRDAIEQLKKDVEKKGLVLKEQERRDLERDYQRRLRDFQRTYQDAQGELQQRDKLLTAEILSELGGIIADFGAKSDYTLILEASNTGAVLYAQERVDITPEIIKLYDAKKAKRR